MKESKSMARRGMAGQLNMFDFFSAEGNSLGEVEMVSLMPSMEEAPVVAEESVVVEEPVEVEEPVVVEAPAVVEEKPIKKKTRTKVVQKRKDDGKVAMSRDYVVNGEKIEIAYLNYNKVRICKGNNEPEIHTFECSKDAVDYYVTKMQELEKDDE